MKTIEVDKVSFALALIKYIEAISSNGDSDRCTIEKHSKHRNQCIVEIISDSHAGYVTLVFDTEENALKFQLTYL